LAGWIGGTHLGPVSKEQQGKTLAQLALFNPEFVAANHCTGFAMMAKLYECFGDRFIPAFVSTVIDV
jgi:7,8-dihydropterin-6-yl-methyl-4-(beta-D-ribofuranosyl)aminobenzene 5'-phosphate synthase